MRIFIGHLRFWVVSAFMLLLGFVEFELDPPDKDDEEANAKGYQYSLSHCATRSSNSRIDQCLSAKPAAWAGVILTGSWWRGPIECL